jgi:transposase
MNQEPKVFERVIGLDAHPDTFTGAFVRGPTPAAAVHEKTFNRVPLDHLAKWAQKHTTANDLFVVEASGNSFHIARTLASMGRRVQVLESRQMGQLKEAHANNDRLSALRIAKAYLAGTAKEVWVPDAKTQQRRDIFHAHRKAVKRTSQVRNRLLSYLSDNGVRCKSGRLTEEKLRPLKDWTPLQWEVIMTLLLEREHAETSRKRWRSTIAREVLSDPLLLSITRLCGVRDVIAFALGALIGDIQRFANAKKLVKYIGLNPAYDHSGEGEWNGGVRGHGRKDLRSLLIEAAQSILRSRQPVARWGKRLLARKSCRALTVCAVARKLVVAVWYLMMGKWTPLDELDTPLQSKMGKIIGELLPQSRASMAENVQALREQVYQRIKSGRVYTLDPAKTFTAQPSLTA